jgi:hypothetical protein
MTSQPSEPTVSAPLRGGCRCGDVRWQARGPFLLHYKCHCHDCQRTSGGGAVALSWLRTDGFAYTGAQPSAHGAPSASGRLMTRRFCPQCGSLVALDMAVPGLMAVSASGLDEPAVFEPACEIWTTRARPWEPLLPGVPHFAEGFDNAWLRERLRPRPPAA